MDILMNNFFNVSVNKVSFFLTNFIQRGADQPKYCDDNSKKVPERYLNIQFMLDMYI